MQRALEKVLHDLLADRLQLIGFASVGGLVFTRAVDGCKQVINVGSRTDGGKLKFTCTLGLRFEEIESILRSGTDDDSYPTVSCPIHLLRPEREYYEWEGGNDEELQVAVESMIAEVNIVGLEFFNKFATIEAIEEELTVAAVSDYIVVSPHQRIGILAAISLARGQRSVAEELFSEALNDPRNLNPGKRRRLEELRSQLLAK